MKQKMKRLLARLCMWVTLIPLLAFISIHVISYFLIAKIMISNAKVLDFADCPCEALKCIDILKSMNNIRYK